jgi:hypothetical protein
MSPEIADYQVRQTQRGTHLDVLGPALPNTLIGV